MKCAFVWWAGFCVFVWGVGERLSDTMCLITYKREQLLDLATVPRRYLKPNNDTFTTLKKLNLLNFRGARGGGNYVSRSWDSNDGVNFSNLQYLSEASLLH